MQTFLPYSNFKKTAQVLDWRRLGKQRVEAMQIHNTIINNTGWKHHPIVKMWTPYLNALKLYHNIIILEWISRGYNNNMVLYDIYGTPNMPHWLGNEAFHSSHRSNLLRKDTEWYSQYNWIEDSTLPYVWFVDKNSEKEQKKSKKSKKSEEKA